MGKKKKHQTGFSERLSALLKARGISQKEGATIAGVSPSVFSGWLHSTSVPADVLALQRFCKALSVPPCESVSFEELLTGSKPESSPTTNESDLSKLFVQDEELYSGYLFVTAKKVRLRRG